MSYTIGLIGSSDKTTWLNQLFGGSTAFISTNYGRYTITFTETINGVDGFIYMYDTTDKVVASATLREYLRRIPSVPLIICATNVDELGHRCLDHLPVTVPRGTIYYSISTKTGYNVWKPVVAILRQITGMYNLILSDKPKPLTFLPQINRLRPHDYRLEPIVKRYLDTCKPRVSCKSRVLWKI